MSPAKPHQVTIEESLSSFPDASTQTIDHASIPASEMAESRTLLDQLLTDSQLYKSSGDYKNFRPQDLKEFATTPDRKPTAIPCLEISPLPQGVWPEMMHVVTPGTGYEPDTYRTGDYAAYFRLLTGGIDRFINDPGTTCSELVSHCDFGLEVNRWLQTMLVFNNFRSQCNIVAKRYPCNSSAKSVVCQ